MDPQSLFFFFYLVRAIFKNNIQREKAQRDNVESRSKIIGRQIEWCNNVLDTIVRAIYTKL